MVLKCLEGMLVRSELGLFVVAKSLWVVSAHPPIALGFQMMGSTTTPRWAVERLDG